MINDLPDDFELDDQPRLARQDVPWARRNQDGAKWGPYFLNKGSYDDPSHDDAFLLDMETQINQAGRSGSQINAGLLNMKVQLVREGETFEVV